MIGVGILKFCLLVFTFSVCVFLESESINAQSLQECDDSEISKGVEETIYVAVDGSATFTRSITYVNIGYSDCQYKIREASALDNTFRFTKFYDEFDRSLSEYSDNNVTYVFLDVDLPQGEAYTIFFDGNIYRNFKVNNTFDFSTRVQATPKDRIVYKLSIEDIEPWQKIKFIEIRPTPNLVLDEGILTWDLKGSEQRVVGEIRVKYNYQVDWNYILVVFLTFLGSSTLFLGIYQYTKKRIKTSFEV